MIRLLSILLARWRHNATVDYIEAAKRQRVQHDAYIQYLCERERQEAIQLLILEGGDVAPALKACAQYRLDAPAVVERKAAAR